MTFLEIANQATTVKGDLRHGVHESVLRSFCILEKVRELLQRGVPADVVVDIIDELQGAPQSDFKELA